MSYNNRAKILAEVLLSQQFVTVKIYDETEDTPINGLITKID